MDWGHDQEGAERIVAEAATYFITEQELLEQCYKEERLEIDMFCTGGGPPGWYIEQAFRTLLKGRGYEQDLI